MATIVQSMRDFFISSFLALPLILFGWSFFIGLTTGNIGLLVLSIGSATVVPILASISEYILDTVLNLLSFGSLFEPTLDKLKSKGTATKNIEDNIVASQVKEEYKELFSVKYCKECSILQTALGCSNDDLHYVFPSMWLAQIVFFFSFIYFNAREIENMKAAEGAKPEKVENRKMQASVVSLIAILLFCAIVFVRYFVLGCETLAGVVYGVASFGTLAYFWYQVAKSCSMKDTDLFGIVQGILPPNINDQGPVACVIQS